MMKSRIGIKTIWVTALLITVIRPAYGQNYLNQVQMGIEHYLNTIDQIDVNGCGDDYTQVVKWVSDFYIHRNYLPAWTDEIGLKPEASLLIGTIREAEKESIFPKTYPLEAINRLASNSILMTTRGRLLSSDMTAQLDILLTTSFFLHSIYLINGRSEAQYFQNIDTSKETSAHLANALEHALSTETFDILLASIEPPHKNYQKLKAAKELYETIVAAGGWAEIPKSPVMEEGRQHDNIILLRKRLMLSGDLTKTSTEISTYFDDTLTKAVQHFQIRHGLTPDGVVGPSTLAALNVSAKKRLEQILVNLERWRQLPRNFGERYIEVNIPDFTLKVIEQGKKVQTMRVVVGRQDRQTPLFYGRMTYLEINPYWTVPPKIAKKDILPKIKQDPSYLIRKQIKVFENWKTTAAELDPLNIDWNQLDEGHFPYRLRQEPAINNALGQIKFMFPNKLNIYLHDTPSKELFQRRKRSYSSGCVRVENPVDLAAYLLSADKGWNRQKLSRILEEENRRPKVILLKSPIPVYLLYWTAWVEDENNIHFRNDIYGRDQALSQFLKKHPPAITTCQNISKRQLS